MTERDQQRGGGAGMETDLERLAQLGIKPVVVPAGQPGDDLDVGRGGDRQQLGRAVQDAEEDGVAKRAGYSETTSTAGAAC
jgi:hypothetical protein